MSPVFKWNQKKELSWARQWLAECKSPIQVLALADGCLLGQTTPSCLPFHFQLIENGTVALLLSVHPQCNAEDRTELATYAFTAFLPNRSQLLFKHDCLWEVWFLKACSSVKSLPVFIRVLQGTASQRELFPCLSLTFKHKLFGY